MFTTDTTQEFKDTIKTFSDVSYQRYNSHSYTAGYYESMMAQMFAQLPKRQQKAFLKDIQAALKDQPVKVRNILTGDMVEITYGERGTCTDPSMELYHSM